MFNVRVGVMFNVRVCYRSNCRRNKICRTLLFGDWLNAINESWPTTWTTSITVFPRFPKLWNVLEIKNNSKKFKDMDKKINTTYCRIAITPSSRIFSWSLAIFFLHVMSYQHVHVYRVAQNTYTAHNVTYGFNVQSVQILGRSLG